MIGIDAHGWVVWTATSFYENFDPMTATIGFICTAIGTAIVGAVGTVIYARRSEQNV